MSHANTDKHAFSIYKKKIILRYKNTFKITLKIIMCVSHVLKVPLKLLKGRKNSF